MSRAKGAGPPLARHLGARSFEDVSGETGRTTSRAGEMLVMEGAHAEIHSSSPEDKGSRLPPLAHGRTRLGKLVRLDPLSSFV